MSEYPNDEKTTKNEESEDVEDLREEFKRLKKEVKRLKRESRSYDDDWDDRDHYRPRRRRPHPPPPFSFPPRFFEDICGIKGGGDFFGDFIGSLGESIGKTVEAAMSGAFEFGDEFMEGVEEWEEERMDVDKFAKLAAPIASALSDENRLRIMKALEPRSLETGELSEKVGITGGNLAHHLGKLQDAGLIRQRRERGRYKLTFVGRMALKSLEALAWKAKRSPRRPITSEDEQSKDEEPASGM